MSPYLAVFISSLLWAISTQIYAKMVQKLTVYRFNFYKSVISFVCFLLACVLTGNFYFPTQAMPYLLLSGFLGFTLADLFIFYSFSKNGPARTLMFSSFSPSIIAVYSYFILGKTLPMSKVAGLFFLLLCLLFIALERKRRGNVSLRVALLAIIGINIEALGVVFTKKSFMVLPDMSQKISLLSNTRAASTLWELLHGWVFSSFRLILKIIILVSLLMILQKILQEFKLIEMLTKPLSPMLKFMGLPESTTFLWIVANSLGLAYGSAVMMEEVKEGRVTKKDADLLNYHVAISHSNLEDLLLFAAIGVSILWMMIPRLIIAIAVVWGRKFFVNRK